MPIIDKSTYKHPWWLPGGHAQSIFPTFFRRVAEPEGRKVRRIETPDGDFIDMDIYEADENNKNLLVLTHGMEGSSRRKYIYGMANIFMDEGWDVLAWNYRSCGPEINLQPRIYHSGDTADIQAVIRYGLDCGYHSIILCGFSMGGSVILNYLGRHADSVPPEVLGALTFSVPCDLTACSERLDKGFHKVYTANFLLTLREKIRKKHEQFPDIYKVEGLGKIKTLKAFDDRYTAPIHGFLSAEDYWYKSSCMHVLEFIRRPVLIVNAKNDPFLAGRCFPLEEANKNERLYLEMPESGGHVGFTPARSASGGGFYWSEQRALEFAREHFFPLATQWP